jgi:tRNA splicing ligase
MIKDNTSSAHDSVAIVKELRQNGFNNLDEYKIKFRRGKKHPHLIEFRYLIYASFTNPICRAARGIILDERNNFGIVALPYHKFFDYDDTKYSELGKFNFKDYKIYEKHDGSLATVYFYEGEWHVASSGVPDG